MDLKKIIETMKGEQRAKLFIRNFHDKTIGGGKGFLSSEEIAALLKFSNNNISNEFSEYIEVYFEFPKLMMLLITSYQHFEWSYEKASKARFLLEVSNAMPPIIMLLDIIKKSSDDASSRGIDSVISFLQLFQIIQMTEDKLVLKQDTREVLKYCVTHMNESACNVLTINHLINRLFNKLGIDNPNYEDGCPSPSQRIEHIKFLIIRHNNTIKEALLNAQSRTIEGLDDYIVPEPTVNQELLKQLGGEMS